LQDHAFNTTTYDEIFTGSSGSSAPSHYYALTFGDIHLIVLSVANVFRSPLVSPTVKGKYQERDLDLPCPERWGHGQHILEAIAPHSPQYEWLQAQLHTPAFLQARYKVVMFHHPPHSLGGNVVPAYTDPVAVIDRDPTGQIRRVRYEYPQTADYLIHAVLPLLEAAGIHLVFYGHSHLWNRFVSPTGVNYLESSNVGNSYGAHVGDHPRLVPTTMTETYAALGNPNGLAPVIPTLEPLRDLMGNPLPYIASNEVTVFSILDTGTGTVSSYRFDTRHPQNPVLKFDEFGLANRPW
jgi:hypothetical protein